MKHRSTKARHPQKSDMNLNILYYFVIRTELSSLRYIPTPIYPFDHKSYTTLVDGTGHSIELQTAAYRQQLN